MEESLPEGSGSALELWPVRWSVVKCRINTKFSDPRLRACRESTAGTYVDQRGRKAAEKTTFRADEHTQILEC